jgi:PAS domain S-box-containing protein
MVVDHLSHRFIQTGDQLPGGAWPESPTQAVMLPLTRAGQELSSNQLAGFLIVGVSPRRTLDHEVQGFYELVAGQVSAAVSNARAYEMERKRAEALAEIDRAKTAFFSNVSHEFRTPLTLMLGPLEEALAPDNISLSPVERQRIELVHRNGLRLLKLVNTLLDFSRLEAGRQNINLQTTSLSDLTAEIASNFRAGVERAGMRLIVNCPPLSQMIMVDREMWEKIVLNLISNAFKYTLDGEIEISLRETAEAIELRVRDTGVGIPDADRRHIFERFYRVHSTQGRTHEGTGIGLSLVRELVQLHAGTIEVESELWRGSTFTVKIPKASAPAVADSPALNQPTRSDDAPALRSNAYVEEVLHWLPDDEVQDLSFDQKLDHMIISAEADNPDVTARILLADDNRDMREYVRRLLVQSGYQVEAVADGQAALDSLQAGAAPPDLILSDVMMPRLDGFDLLAAIRADENLKTTPVILLSARAGEESKVEGLTAGADDYLIKPFSARELLARVEAHLRLQRVRREAERAVRDQTVQFETLLNQAPLGVYLVDADFRLRQLNPIARSVFGNIPNLIGRDFDEVIHLLWAKDYADEIVRLFRQTLETGEPYVTPERVEQRLDRGVQEYYEWRIDRIPLPHERPDKRYGVVCYFRDISEQVLTRNAIFESEERYRMLFDSIDEGFCIIEVIFDEENKPVDYRFIQANPAFERLTGLVDAIGRTVRELVPDLEAFWVETCGRVALTGEAVRVENESVPMNRWFDIYASRVGDAESRRVAVVFNNITERKRVEAALREADQRKDEFLAMLAHELRNPLAPIRNAAQVLKLVGQTDAKQQWAREVIERQTQHLTRLVDDLLDVSRITSGKVTLQREPLDLATIIGRAVETSQPLIDSRRHRLVLTLPPESLFVEGDLTRLVQVVGNLLNNAAKYTDEGGHIWVKAARHGDEAVIRIRDDGIGLPAELLPRIFDLFTQADQSLDRSQGGLGIGLTLVRSLVELHGGSVEARSDGATHGCEFIVRLPLVIARDAEPKSRRAQSDGPNANRKNVLRVLVVEDNLDSAEMMAFIMRLNGHDVRMARDGISALEMARTFRPQVVLCDIGLPDMNGYEVAERLRGQPDFAQTRLIALSGYGQDEARQRAKEAGFDHHLVKPVEPDALVTLLGSVSASDCLG